jgi:LDH2 family malate/lactate/ureidoglycolate dehydrogenase
MPFDQQLSNLYDTLYDTGRKIGHLFICANIRAFSPLELFRERLTELLGIFRQCPTAGEATSVVVPGDFERSARAERLAHGVPLSDEAWRFFEPHVTAVLRAS